MKLGIALAGALLSTSAAAQTLLLKGSDTLSSLMTQAISASGLTARLSYQGGGSTLGETALVAKEQGLAPMSRAFKPAAIQAAQAAGITPVPHVIGLDGLAILVKNENVTPKMTIDTLKKIYECTYAKWEEVPSSGLTGPIKAYRRNDVSGTTDTFKSLVGVTAFGSCVTVVAETSDIAYHTSREANAIGYAGLSGRVDGNRAVRIAKDDASDAKLPTAANIRSKSYPLARDLFVYEATGSFTPGAAERELLGRLKNRSFIDPILQDNDFITLD